MKVSRVQTVKIQLECKIYQLHSAEFAESLKEVRERGGDMHTRMDREALSAPSGDVCVSGRSRVVSHFVLCVISNSNLA